jgi:predicted MFS family arabinose efflux permease
VALVGLLFLRLPAGAPRPESDAPGGLHREMLAGVRWLLGQPLLRAIAGCAVTLNFLFYAYYLVVLSVAQQRGVPAAQIGVMAAALGVGGLLGALAAPLLHRVLRPHVSIVGVFWALAALTPLAAVLHDGYLIGALFGGMAFLTPTANTTIMTYQLLLTPDDLRGRLAGVMGVLGGIAATAGPAVGGVLVQAVPGGVAVLVCAGAIAVLAVVATASRSLRTFPGGTEGSASPGR